MTTAELEARKKLMDGLRVEFKAMWEDEAHWRKRLTTISSTAAAQTIAWNIFLRAKGVK